jgi:hypothetical protein
MPLAIDNVYCPNAGAGTDSPRSTKVIADCAVFPDCGCTLSGPVQLVPGVPVVHCADENTESKVMMPINK